jgi:molybdopterin/thiamine biosynthesis adenylyltransferase
MEEIDEGLYSRQLLVLGAKAMHSMGASRVFLSGLGALGVEVAKNVVLGGVKSFTCHDNEVVRACDLNFFCFEEDIGRNRAEVSAPKLAELNPYVKVNWTSGALVSERLQEYTLVIVTEQTFQVCQEVDAFCRSRGIKFIAANVIGLRKFCSYVISFADQKTNQVYLAGLFATLVWLTRCTTATAKQSTKSRFFLLLPQMISTITRSSRRWKRRNMNCKKGTWCLLALVSHE